MATSSSFLRLSLSRQSHLQLAHCRSAQSAIVRPALFQPRPPLQNSFRLNSYRSITCQQNTTAPFSPISSSPIYIEGSSSNNNFAHVLFQNFLGFGNKNFQAVLFSFAAFYSWKLTGVMFDWVALKYKDKYVKNCQLLDCAKNPLRVSLVVYFFLEVAFLLSTSVLGKYDKYLPKLRITILLLFVGKSLYNALDMVLIWFFPSDKNKKMMQERTNIHMISSIFSFCGLFLATLETWGISGHSALVTGGILCAATSFALKDVFENFLKGLWLRFLEPYGIGDHIMLNSEKLDGKVIDIGLTSITIIDKKTGVHVVVPNTSLSQKCIFNVSRATHVVVEEKFTIPIEDLDKVKSIIKSSNQMLISDFSAEDYCTLSGVGESGIELTVFCKVKKMDNDIGEVYVQTIRQSVLFNIADIILTSGATIGKKDKKKNEDD